MQKYQNFVVEAGRQCWPGDAYGEKHKLATRPDDMRADQWIYNIIKVCFPDLCDSHYCKQ